MTRCRRRQWGPAGAQERCAVSYVGHSVWHRSSAYACLSTVSAAFISATDAAASRVHTATAIAIAIAMAIAAVAAITVTNESL